MRHDLALALGVSLLLLLVACSGGGDAEAPRNGASQAVAALQTVAAPEGEEPAASAGVVQQPQAPSGGTAGPAEAPPAAGRSAPPDDADPRAEPATAPAPAGPTLQTPEFEGLSGWINSDALILSALIQQNRVVLIDFWTYTCVNCVRTLPFLREWHEKYSDRGLTIIGVHAPEFEFEKDRTNVLGAVERFQLQYSIAQDNEMATWRAFRNRSWPAKYLIGTDGALRYQHFGEGAYVETEKEIRGALEDAGWDVSDVPLGTVDVQEVDPNLTVVTRELYGGYQQNYNSDGVYAWQPEYYQGPDREVLYEDTRPDLHATNFWYLQGLWRNEAEAIVHARETEAYEDYIAARFVARSVNVVIQPVRDQPFDVVIELAGRPLTLEELGADVSHDDQGRSVLHVDEPRMYAIVELPGIGEHDLTLRSNSDNFAVFAFTFGAYTEGP